MKPGIDHIGVGCGCIIFNDKNEILLLKRSKNSKTDREMWSRPGGTVEFGETIEDALIREIKEETNLDIKIIKPLDITNDLKQEDGMLKHWIAIGFLGKVIGGELKNMEPNKHEEVSWFSLDNLPDNITKYTLNGLNIVLKSSK
jgi:8-oxo-dGTP diphosphatase